MVFSHSTNKREKSTQKIQTEKQVNQQLEMTRLQQRLLQGLRPFFGLEIQKVVVGHVVQCCCHHLNYEATINLLVQFINCYRCLCISDFEEGPCYVMPAFVCFLPHPFVFC